MTVTVNAVPDSITRPQLVDWLAQIGIDANHVPAGTAINLGRTAIEVEVYAYGPDGQLLRSPDALSVARHKIVIPIVDEHGHQEVPWVPLDDDPASGPGSD